MAKRVFGELELEVLRVFQKADSACTVRDVLTALGKKDKYTTIMTVMNRLVEKGDLQKERKGASYQYSLHASKDRNSLFEKWRQKVFGGKSAHMISFLLKSGEGLTEKEFVQIENMIEKARRKAP